MNSRGVYENSTPAGVYFQGSTKSKENTTNIQDAFTTGYTNKKYRGRDNKKFPLPIMKY